MNRMDKLTEKHNGFLTKELGMTLEEFRSKPQADLEKLADDTLIWIECELDGERSELAADLVTAIYGVDPTPEETAT